MNYINRLRRNGWSSSKVLEHINGCLIPEAKAVDSWSQWNNLLKDLIVEMEKVVEKDVMETLENAEQYEKQDTVVKLGLETLDKILMSMKIKLDGMLCALEHISVPFDTKINKDMFVRAICLYIQVQIDCIF